MVGLIVALALGGGGVGCSNNAATDEAGTTTTTPVTASTTTTLAPGAEVTFAVFDPFSVELKESLANGGIDIALLFSTDGAIAENEWVLLDDDKGLADKENVAPLIRADANSAEITEALASVSRTLTTAELTELNRRSAQASPPDVVTGWLESNGLLPYGGSEVSAALTVGSTDFTESLLLAEMYAQVLESAGAEVTRAMRFGSREEVIPAVEAGDLDLVPEFVSSVLRYYQPDAVPPLLLSDVLADARNSLNSSLELLDPSTAQDAPGFVVTAETAERLGLEKVSDLSQLSESLVLGGPQDCPTSITCIAGLEQVYRVPIDLG